MEWLAQHSGFVHSGFTVDHDGKTTWEPAAGRKWNRPMVEFGEKVMGKLALQRIYNGNMPKSSV